jgi:hypothetical protein
VSEYQREQNLQRMRDMETILPRVKAQLLRFPNVVTVVVGARERQGVATDEPAFQVYVSTKKDIVELAAEERIPPEIEGFRTDVILFEEQAPLQGTVEDTEEYRPLFGGSQLVQGNHIGTLGVIAVATVGSKAPVGQPVILTNWHVAPKEELVGQPSSPCDCWCCECCHVGTVVDTQVTAQIDAAIATLRNGITYSHEILEIGPIRGDATATAMTSGDVVFKRGRTTGLREGRFSTASAPLSRSDGHNFTNQIRITSPPPTAPATTMTPFALGGDSGSVVTDTRNRIIGLLHSSSLPAGTPSTASRIEDVVSALHVRFPVMGTAGAFPLLSVEAAQPDSFDRRIAALTATYAAREEARRWRALIDQHRQEVLTLVRHHRPTTLVWQRCQGPSFVSHYMKTLRDAVHVVPDEIGGVRLENLIVGMAATLRMHGSPALAADVARHYLDVLEGFHTSRRLVDVMDWLTRNAPAKGQQNPR